MNKLFEKVIARTVLEVLWEKKTSVMSGDLYRAVELKLGRTPSKRPVYSGGDINAAIQMLERQGRIEAKRIEDKYAGCLQPAIPVITYAYSLPILDQIAAYAPEV